MTNREFYTAIASMTNVPAEIVEFASDAIAKLDARNEKAKAKPRKADPAVTERKDAVARFVIENDGEFTADEIAAILGLTAPQVASAMRVHVAGGRVTKGSRKIDSKHTKVTYVIGA